MRSRYCKNSLLENLQLQSSYTLTDLTGHDFAGSKKVQQQNYRNATSKMRRQKQKFSKNASHHLDAWKISIVFPFKIISDVGIRWEFVYNAKTEQWTVERQQEKSLTWCCDFFFALVYDALICNRITETISIRLQYSIKIIETQHQKCEDRNGESIFETQRLENWFFCRIFDDAFL